MVTEVQSHMEVGSKWCKHNPDCTVESEKLASQLFCEALFG